MQTLDWQRFPLAQSALIEASAGTGKTHTLVLLMLRALLERQLRLKDILLCTFTLAATAELSARVQTRIDQLAAWHAHFQTSAAAPVLADGDVALWQYLAERWSQSEILHSDTARIRQAQSDALSFSAKTLHGFCAEVLQRFPVECQSLVDLSGVDETLLLEQALSDTLLALSAGAGNPAAPHWQQGLKLNQAAVKKLLSSLTRAYNYSELEVLAMPIPPAPCSLPELYQQPVRSALIEAIAQALGTDALALRVGTKRVLSTLQGWLIQLRDTADKEAAGWPQALAECDGADLKLALNDGAQTKAAKLPIPAELDDCFSIFAWQSRLKVAEASALFEHLLSAVRARMQSLMRASQLMSFEQIIEQVKHALTHRSGASKAEILRTERLQALLRSAYPLAVVDEFQDTNASQFAVLDAIYAPHRFNESESANAANIILIGDPKQAIFRFRGGDVYNYLRTANRLPRYVLRTNYRASRSLVDALNAFYLPIASQAFAIDGIEFHTVEKGLLGDSTQAALTLAILDSTAAGKPSQSREVWSAHCIEASALQVQAHIASGIKAAEIAILLPRRVDIDTALAALQSLGIAAHVSARTEVVASEPALALMRILQCIAAPADRKLQRAASFAAPFSLPAAALGTAVEQELTRWFAALPALLSEQGILAITDALAQLCAQQALHEQSRWQIDLRHLGELLAQNCAAQTDSKALMASFDALLVASGAHADEPNAGKLRGAAQGAVSLLTLHSAKGLEFPHVLLPLLWSAQRRASSDYPLCTNASGTQIAMQIDLGSANYSASVAREKQELLAELLRLQYVGITRAALSVWIAVPTLAMAEPTQNALHYSLNLLGKLATSRDDKAGSSWAAGIEHLLRSASVQRQSLELSVMSEQLYNARRSAALQMRQSRESEPSVARAQTVALIYSARKAQRRLSYSAIAKMSHVMQTGLSAPQPQLDLLDAQADAELLALAPIRGRSFGLIAHTLFENLWPFDVARWFALLDARIQALARSDPGMALLMAEPARLSALRSMFERTALAPLTPVPGSCNLAALEPEQRIVELEFHLPMPRLNLDKLANLGPKHGLPALLDNVVPERLSGMLQGFIDLVFLDQGRYYVLDYKTNALGDCLANYQIDCIAAEMTQHQYHLQHVLYQFALHRYLSANLPGYQFEQHFGGAIYLFLRGFGRAPGLGYFQHRASAELLADLAQIFGA